MQQESLVGFAFKQSIRCASSDVPSVAVTSA